MTAPSTSRSSAYLDYAATAPMRPDALAALREMYGAPANPAAQHGSGRQASKRLEDARASLARLLGVTAAEVVFTSGGTEADAIAITGLFRNAVAESPERNRVLVSPVEHKAVLSAVRALPGAEIVELPVDADGAVDPQAVSDALAGQADRTALAAVMWGNNEVGTVNDIPAIAEICREAGVPLHSDAVQMPATRQIRAGSVTTLALSAHKVGGPVGIGALVVRRGTDLPVYSHGGEQEGGIRSGTVNVAGAVAMAAAMQEAHRLRRAEVARIGELRDRLREEILSAVPDAVHNGSGADVLVSHLHLSIPGCDGDTLLMLLDGAGVEVSTGSACNVGIPKPSHVLLAMGRDPELARGSLRLTLGWATTAEDVDRAVAAVLKAIPRSRRAGYSDAAT